MSEKPVMATKAETWEMTFLAWVEAFFHGDFRLETFASCPQGPACHTAKATQLAWAHWPRIDGLRSFCRKTGAKKTSGSCHVQGLTSHLESQAFCNRSVQNTADPSGTSTVYGKAKKPGS